MKIVKKNSSGFTLIELLIVIAVIGVLAAVILVALNPLEQLARGRDSGRKNSVGQLATAVQAFYTSRQGVYPVSSSAWATSLVNTGELKAIPGSVQFTPACTKNLTNGYCYDTSGTEAKVYVALESISDKSKCGAAATSAYFAWISGDSRSGIVCTDPGVGGYSGYTYN